MTDVTDVTDDIDKLVTDVHKTISDNKLFLEKLVDEAIEDDSEEETEVVAADDDFEEL